MALLTAIALGVSLAATAYGMYEKNQQADLAHKQTDEANKRAVVEKRMAEMKNQQARNDVLRKQRLLQSRMENEAANSGTSGSSGAIGGLDALTLDTNRQLSDLSMGAGFQDTLFSSTQTSANYGRASAEAGAAADAAGAVGSVAGGVFEAAGGYKSIFDATQGSSKSAGGINDANIFT